MHWSQEILFVNMKTKVLDDSFRVVIVIFTAVLYCLGLIWFLEPAGIYSAGATGLAQIIKQLFDQFVKIPLGVYTFLINFPLFIYGWKKVSRRFSIYSILSVVVQSICTMGWIPVVNFGLDPQTNQLTFALIGGIVTGVACGIALRYGTSTGGLDILGQVFALEKNVSIGNFTMIANVVIAFVGGAWVSGSWPIVIYTCIRIIITSIVIDKIHTAYNYVKLSIISSDVDAMVKELLEMNRGCTMIPAKGGYSRNDKFDLIMVISSYEIDKAVAIVKAHDPKAFIIVEPVKRLFGNYVRKSIV